MPDFESDEEDREAINTLAQNADWGLNTSSEEYDTCYHTLKSGFEASIKLHSSSEEHTHRRRHVADKWAAISSLPPKSSEPPTFQCCHNPGE